MVSRKFYTQEELDEARRELDNLPDLSPQRITRSDALNSLKDKILMLSKDKGYSSADIKSALDSMNFKFSEKAISEVISESEGPKRRRKPKNCSDNT